MSGAIKLCALERLAAVIEREVPALRGRVCAGPADRAHLREFPHLVLIPETFRFESWDQYDETDPRSGLRREPTPNTVIQQVGEWVGIIRIELGATDSKTRALLEELVERAFLSGSGSDVSPLFPDPGSALRAGVILIDAEECYGARMAFLLEDDTWSQEAVFSDEWYSIMRVTAELPALVPRYKAYAMTDVRLFFTESLETVVEVGVLPGDTEKVRINTDGSVTAVP